MKNLLISIALFLVYSPSILAIGCIDPEGKEVDWFVALKYPTYIDEDGVKYDYVDSQNTEEFSTFKNINDEDSVLTRTVRQIQNLDDEDTLKIFWNDQSANESDHGSFAHSKGIIGANLNQGKSMGKNKNCFVIIHSVPRYPDFTTGDVPQIILNLPKSGLKFGQHIFCISLDQKNINNYGQALLVDRPFVFPESSIPQNLKRNYSFLGQLLNNSYRVDEDYLDKDIYSLNNQLFTKFAKSRSLVVPIYSTFVAPYYNQDMQFETWTNGAGGVQQAFCQDPQVFSVEYVEAEEGTFKHTQDHSKYGVSLDGNQCCFGDVNRMDSQSKRGGGTVCFSNQNLAKLLRKRFISRQRCDDFQNKGIQFKEQLLEHIQQIFLQ